MTIREAMRAAKKRLERAGVPDADVDTGLLFEHVLGVDRLRLLVDGQREMPQAAQQALTPLLERREKREPLQYILGEAYFMGLRFHVESGVLIPRPDTEILCEEALSGLEPGMRVLDIGTGSGALAAAIKAHCPGADVTAVDVSDTALRLAKHNARENGADVRFVRSDCFSALAGETFDLIVSNPPYISDEEMKTLMPEVLMEPELALRADMNGLYFYDRITREAGAYLRMGGRLLFEIGWKQKDDVCALLAARVGEPFALRDYGGNWRVCGAKREK